MEKLTMWLQIIIVTLLMGWQVTLQAQDGYDPLNDSASTVFFRVVNVNAKEGLNIRQAPNAKSKSVGKIPPKESCVAYLNTRDSSKQWAKITYNGIQGWADLAHLEQHNAPACWRYYRVVNINANDTLTMRQLPNLNSQPVTKIDADGSCLLRLDDAYDAKKRVWFMVEHNGVRGWVNSYYLTTIQVDECDV
jgi:SH3-like domain-containing protein